MTRRYDPQFEPVLRTAFDPDELDRLPATIVGLWPDTRIAYLNPAWDTFAGQNGGQPLIAERWGLGAVYLDAVPEPLGPFYRGLLDSASASTDSLRPTSHDYMCPSAALERLFNMQVYSLPHRAGYVIIHSLRIERPHAAGKAETPPDTTTYFDANGLLHQCSHCRRVQNLVEDGAWDWVPQWVEHVWGNTSHTICPPCFEYYYRSPARREDE
ncbi:MAG: hypothetical protein ABMA15_17270 [Vicinamibacterales bacterium]